MTYFPVSVKLLPAQRSTYEPQLVLYCDNGLVASALRHLLSAQYSPWRIMTAYTADAVSCTVRALPDTRLIAVISQGGAEAFARLRALLHLQQKYSRLKLMALSGYVSSGLLALVPQYGGSI